LAMDNHLRKVRSYPRPVIGNVLIEISQRSHDYVLPDHVTSPLLLQIARSSMEALLAKQFRRPPDPR
jgi:hypothetical protein